MKNVRVMCVAVAISAALSGCQKSPEDLEKEQQEKLIRETMVKQIQDGKEIDEAKKRPGALSNGYVYKPAKNNLNTPNTNENKTSDQGQDIK
jgi:hypothetical protein